MGCRKSRPAEDRQSYENLRLHRYESSLGLSSVSPYVYEASIRRLQQSSLPLGEGFVKILENLDLTVPESFIACLQTQFNEGCSLNSFLIFLILISKGTEKMKIDSMWSIFDLEMKDELNKGVLNEMLEALVSASYLFSIDALIASQGAQDEASRLEHWKGQTKDKHQRVVQRLLKHFLPENNTLTKQEFALKTNDRPLGNVLSLQGIRSQIDDTQVIPNKFANPFKNMKVTRLQKSS